MAGQNVPNNGVLAAAAAGVPNSSPREDNFHLPGPKHTSAAANHTLGRLESGCWFHRLL